MGCIQKSTLKGCAMTMTNQNQNRARFRIHSMLALWILAIVAPFVFSFFRPDFFEEVAIEVVLLLCLFTLGFLTNVVERQSETPLHPKLRFFWITFSIGVAAVLVGVVELYHNRIWYLIGIVFPTLDKV